MLSNFLLSKFAGNFVIGYRKLRLVIVSENGVAMIWILTGKVALQREKAKAILFVPCEVMYYFSGFLLLIPPIKIRKFWT